MKRLRLTNPEITKYIGYRTDGNRILHTIPGFKTTIEDHKRKIKKILKPFLAPIQVVLDEVNGRAYANVIREARQLFDIAIEVEIELRAKGVTIKNMSNTTVYYCGFAGFKGVSTGVHLKRCATGWFATQIEKSYAQRSRYLISITPEARADIIRIQLGDYEEAQENTERRTA